MLALLLGALSLFAAASAQAQAVTLVSNTGQTANNVFATGSTTWAQVFTTGTNTGGYTLSSIEVVVNATANTAERATIRAELWSAATGGAPNAKVADLTVPSTVSAGTVSFAAPANTTLTASTTYHVVLYTVGNYNIKLSATASTAEDSGGAPGWSIGNTAWLYEEDTPTTSGETWKSGSSVSITDLLRIAVKGAAKETTTTTPISGIWSEEMNPGLVRSSPSVIGCANDGAFVAQRCTNTGILDTTTFNYGGKTYRIDAILLNEDNGELTFRLTTHPISDLSGLSFCSGSSCFAFDEATISSYTDDRMNVAKWSSTGLSWPVGNNPTLSIAQQTTTTTPVRNLLTGLTISDGTNNLPLQPNLANAAGLRGPGIYAVHVEPGIREIFVTPTFTEATVNARTYGASGGAGGTSQLGHETWGSSESGTAKSLPLLSYDGVTRLQIEIGSALYQIYVYHNYDWDTRLRQLEMLTN